MKNDYEDPLSAAKGILLGIVLSIPLWMIIVLIVIYAK